MEYWLAFWWVFFVAVAICITVCTVGIEGAILFVPFFAVVFPLVTGQRLSPLEAVQIGLFTEIVGFTSSFIGFFRAKLIDYGISWKSIAIAVPFALGGGFLTYIVPAWVLLAVVVVILPVMGYLVLREAAEPCEACETGEPLLPAIAGGSGEGDGALRTLTDARGRSYAYAYSHDHRRSAVSAAGGLFEGLVGFGIGAAGITDLVVRKLPVRVAIGTSHMIIMMVAFAAVTPHFIELGRAGSVPWNIIIFTVPAVAIGGQIARHRARPPDDPQADHWAADDRPGADYSVPGGVSSGTGLEKMRTRRRQQIQGGERTWPGTGFFGPSHSFR